MSRYNRSHDGWNAIEQVLAFVGAGIAAVAARAAMVFFAPGLTGGTTSDPDEIVLVTAVVFFAVLIALGRQAFTNARSDNSDALADASPFAPKATPQETSDAMAGIFAGVTDDASRRRAILEWLASVPKVTVLIPLVFYLRFGKIGPLSWGLTVFFDVYCLLWAIGLYFRPRTEYHTPVRLRGDWIDKVGAFWLVACAFGPLFGWVVTEAFSITPGSWRWLYSVRALLAAGAPLLLALPLLRYVRGKSSLVTLPLLVVLTLLPVSTATWVIQDLWEGPSASGSELYLKHTERSLGSLP